MNYPELSHLQKYLNFLLPDFRVLLPLTLLVIVLKS